MSSGGVRRVDDFVEESESFRSGAGTSSVLSFKLESDPESREKSKD